MIEIKSLTFQYSGSEKSALSDISLKIPDKSFVGIIGPAGAGKTTLSYAISGIIPHHFKGDYYGSVTVEGMDTVDSALTDISRAVGMVFQDVESQIIFSVVEDEMLYGLENFGVPRDEIPGRIDSALRQVGIEDLRTRSIASLSGGQRQKVAIASIIALRPKILLLDEPTGELDPGSSRQVFELLKTLNREYGLTVIIVEQKIMLLCEFGETLIVMSQGAVRYHGPVREVLSNYKELKSLGVNCPQVATLAALIREKTGRPIPIFKSVPEAESCLRGLIS
jgi:energy-coupling factor transport system ATP-binding protein